MTATTGETFDPEAFLKQCRAYLAKRHIDDEDLLSEMILVAMEQNERDPAKPLVLKFLFLSAYNRLYPNIQVNQVKVRKASFVVSWDDLERVPDPVAEPAFHIDDIPCRLPVSGPVRAMIILSMVYRYTQQEIAVIFGCSQPFVSELMHQSWLPKYLDDEIGDLIFDDLRIPIQWTTIA